MKRAAALILAIAAALALSGCASIFDKVYFQSEEFISAPEESPADAGRVEVGSYLQLTLAINNLVSEHGESVVIHFTGYEGDIAEDLAAACREVSTGTALGEYGVDYISYDLDRIVAYYEAEVYVYYKRTAVEFDEIVSVNTETGLYDAICETLSDMGTSLVAMVGASSVDEQAVLDFVSLAFRSNPMACVEEPEAEANVYTGGGFQRIVELELDYGATPAAMASRQSVLENAIGRMLDSTGSGGGAHLALQCAVALTSECRWDEGAPGTLWSALMAGSADSEGMALAYKALCDAAGIECQVVAGRFDRAEHYWNIITLDSESYHVDVSRAGELGFGATFLMSDAQMWGSYWWDDQYYPECSGSLSYSALVGGGPSESAGPEESPPPEMPAEESAPPQEA